MRRDINSHDTCHADAITRGHIDTRYAAVDIDAMSLMLPQMRARRAIVTRGALCY